METILIFFALLYIGWKIEDIRIEKKYHNTLIEKQITNKASNAISEIENVMERWHHARDNDRETLENINNILVSIGKLGWFNK